MVNSLHSTEILDILKNILQHLIYITLSNVLLEIYHIWLTKNVSVRASYGCKNLIIFVICFVLSFLSQKCRIHMYQITTIIIKAFSVA